MFNPAPIPSKRTSNAPVQAQHTDWRTLALWVGCFGAWAGAVFVLPQVSLTLAFVTLALVLVLHSSLSHEILHGHPFPIQWMNTAMGLMAVGLFVPYLRFRDTHLAHHIDERLTDPYDDPESNYHDPAVWEALSPIHKVLLRFNNTMCGRMLVGPMISQLTFCIADARAPREWQVARAWLLHVPAVVITLYLVALSDMPIWAYIAAAYAAMSILKIRTFLEHRAAIDPTARTVIVEGRGPLHLLFLNNSLHVVHHMHPKMPWYALPALYRGNKQSYQACNQGYVYASYTEVFRRYFLTAKDPVAHPRWPLD